MEYKAPSGKFLVVMEPRNGEITMGEHDTNAKAHAAASKFCAIEGGVVAWRATVYDDEGNKTPPDSYLDARRPPLQEAVTLEGASTVAEAIAKLAEKGFFTPAPRPFTLGLIHLGNGHSNPVIVDKFGDPVTLTGETLEFIIAACNAYSRPT